MKARGLLTCLLAPCFLLSCTSKKSTSQPKSDTGQSAEVHIGYRQVLTWNVPPAPNGQSNGVQGIAVDNEGRVYVADSEGRRVLVYSLDGNLLMMIEPDAEHPKILQRPFGLLLDGHDRLYVTDYDADQIQVFSTGGKFLFAWGREGKGRAQFRAPVAIDQDRQGDLYVVEFYGMRVQKFTHEGKFRLTWGSEAPWGKPTPPEQLLYPSGLAVGPNGNIFVTDSGHDQIKVFTSEGEFVKEWGVKGIKPGDLNAAGGLSFDAAGRLHEADAANHRVQMFTPEGQFLGEWFLPNAGNLKLWSPVNVRAVGSQFLYVSDVAENKIYKLAIEPTCFSRPLDCIPVARGRVLRPDKHTVARSSNPPLHEKVASVGSRLSKTRDGGRIAPIRGTKLTKRERSASKWPYADTPTGLLEDVS